MFLFILAALAQPNTAPADAVSAAIKGWDECLNKFADAGAITIDPANVVAEAALYNCEAEAAQLEREWYNMVITKSVTIRTPEEAKESAASVRAEFTERRRRNLMVSIQFQRQIAAIRARAK